MKLKATITTGYLIYSLGRELVKFPTYLLTPLIDVSTKVMCFLTREV